MDQKLFFTTAATVTWSLLAEPFEYFFSSVDPQSGRDGTKPEKMTALLQKSKGKYTIAGAASRTRLRIEEAVFSAYPDESSKTLDPALYIALYKLSSTKSNRILSTTAEGAGENCLPLTITRPDPYSIRVVPAVAMVPGEYALIDKTTTTSAGHVTVWTFGID